MSGRPRSFDTAAVLDSAMSIFWEQGYDATSYPDLVEATGIGRQSLYQAFGDKRSLFTQVLKHYGCCVTQESIEILQGAGSPKQNIYRWLNRLRERAVAGRNGCLLTNTAIELAPRDPEVARLVQQELKRVEHALAAVLRRAIDVGEMPAQTEAGELAIYFFGVVQGLMVMGRLGLSRAKLKRYTDAALATIGVQ